MYKEIPECLACGGKDLHRYLNLERQPLANSYSTEPNYNPITYPLEVMFCTCCSHSQLSVAVDPSEMFSDYKYVSGTSPELMKNFAFLASKISQNAVQQRVMDIGGNDGSFLKLVKGKGHDVLNIDPAANLKKVSEDNGVPCRTMFWNGAAALGFDYTPNLITAFNVFGHNSNPYDFLIGCRRVLAKGGSILVEFPYGKSIVEKYAFDQWYHEHCNEFTVKSFVHLAERAGFSVARAVQNPVHGGSLSLQLTRDGSGHHSSVRELIAAENLAGMSDLETYQHFAKVSQQNIDKLSVEVAKLCRQGYHVVMYGASAKSSVLLNSSFKQDIVPSVNGTHVFARKAIEVIIDDNPFKQGLYSPGANIKIVGPDYITTDRVKMAFICGAYNLFDTFRAKIKAARPEGNDVMVSYIPSVEVHQV